MRLQSYAPNNARAAGRERKWHTPDSRPAAHAAGREATVYRFRQAAEEVVRALFLGWSTRLSEQWMAESAAKLHQKLGS
jgi:hypothetical protein